MKYQTKDIQKSLFRLLMHLQRHQHQEAGYSLVVTVAMILIVTSLLVTTSIMGKIEKSSTNAAAKNSKGFHAAEAGLNRRAALVRNKFDGFNKPEGEGPNSWRDCVDADSTNDGSDDLACDDSMTFLGQNIVTYVDGSEAETAQEVIIPDDELYGGLSAQEYSYKATSVALDSQEQPNAILSMEFKSRLVPMFQFLSFFDKDFELAYPPTMNLNGSVHANGDVYLNSSGSNTLTIDGQISSTGALYRGLKFDNSCTGTVNVYNPTTAASVACAGSREEFDVNNNPDDWNGEINIGTTKLTPPPLESFDPEPGKPYWDRADLRLVVDVNDTSPSIEIRTQNDTNDSTKTDLLLDTCPVANTTLTSDPDTSTTSLTVDSAADFSPDDVIRVGTDNDSNVIESISGNTIELKYPLGSDPSSGDAVRKSIVSTSNTFWNNREKRTGDDGNANRLLMRLLDVDVQGLLDCAQTTGIMNVALDDDTQGGLVWYLTVKGPDSDTLNNYGVRVYNGAALASTVSGAPDVQGLTIVSDNALYVQGDYNTTDKKPASFLVDTINILSNNWKISKDDKSDDAVQGGTRNPTETTVNAAFLSGHDTTGDEEGSAGQDKGFNASYGGGFENYPRFHENWSGVPFNYRGSFVTLGKPQKANGTWCGTGNTCNIYVPPFRNWDYDTDFDDAANLPPMTPRAVYLKQELFEQEFDRTAVQPRQPQLKFASLFPFNFLGLLRPPQLSLYKGLQGR